MQYPVESIQGRDIKFGIPEAALTGMLDMMPYSYPLRTLRSLPLVDVLAFVLHIPPKYPEISESGKRFSLLKSSLIQHNQGSGGHS